VHLMELDGLDLAFAQRELFESAVAMGRAALKASGIGSAEIERVERAYRSRDCERLELQSSTGDLHAGLERSFGADRALPEEEEEKSLNPSP
jgi:glutathione-regulated potassium-efflux system protein KefB